jgi:hypothetical protein
MTQYIALIQGNAQTDSTPEEWAAFYSAARRDGLFKGGSEIGPRMLIGNGHSAKSTSHVVGYMRFDTDDKQKLLRLLEQHPVVIHGGSVELCEMPES